MRRNKSNIPGTAAGNQINYITALIFLSCFISFIVKAQQPELANYQQQYQLHIYKTSSPVKIDGDLSDDAWQTKDSASGFNLHFPRDDEKANHNATIVRVTYDDNFLYLSVVAYDSMPLIGQSLKRDSRIRDNDGVSFIIDPVNKKTNGFYFSVTAFNVQGDDQLSNNFDEPNFSWDNKWYSATKQFDDHYNVEVAIPFKALRYDQSNTTWGVNFVRSVMKKNEYHTWTRVPVNFRAVDLGYTGALVWDAAPPKPGSNIALIPYTTGSVSQDKVNGDGNVKATINAGIDGKFALSSKMNLDLTVNPDFSQVEVDRQQTNLTRFSLFFPERRFFFLENDDVFSSFGTPPARPFYSRRIGLDENGNTIPILFGARLTGNITDNLRLGIMSMQTGEKYGNPSQNYSAVTLAQRVLKRSSVKVYYLDHESFASSDQLKENPLSKYGRNVGGEFSFSDEAGKVNAWAGFHKSFKPGVKKDDVFLNAGAGYFGKSLSAFVDYIGMGTNYYADMGFLRRIENYDAEKDSIIRYGYHTIFSEVGYSFYPKKGNINVHGLVFENFLALNPDGTFNERTNSIGYKINFKNSSQVSANFGNNETDLLFPTSFTDGEALPKGHYQYNQVTAEYKSDQRKIFSYQASIAGGEFYNGKSTELVAGITFRNQPWLTIELNAEYNKLSFPAPYGSANLFLLAPRVEINFSTSIFWTTFIQYNTQGNNFNINSRLQWRYKPMSDLFIVYTDNYFTDPLFKNKSRSLVFKLNYWLNM